MLYYGYSLRNRSRTVGERCTHSVWRRLSHAMKQRSLTPKATFGDLLLGALAIYGASWLGYFGAAVPLYILRGNYHNMEMLSYWEAVTMSAVGLLVTVLFLVLFYSRQDAAGRAGAETVLVRSAGAAVLNVILWPIQGGLVAIAPIGVFVAEALDRYEARLTTGGLLGAMAICFVIFTLAVMGGYALARRRHQKERGAIIEEGEHRKRV